MKQLLVTMLLIGVIVGCDNGTDPVPPVQTGETITRTDLRADSAVGWLYYSIDGDSVVPPELAATTPWDIRMAYLLCCGKTRAIRIQLNSGNAGSGSTTGAMMKNRYENISSVPAGLTLRTEDTLAPVVPLALLGSEAMFIYQGSPHHTLAPSPDRVLAVKTAKGRTVKFQFTSIYQGAPTEPTQLTPLGFYHFRYATIR